MIRNYATPKNGIFQNLFIQKLHVLCFHVKIMDNAKMLAQHINANVQRALVETNVNKEVIFCSTSFK
jgi:hypothetical protein